MRSDGKKKKKSKAPIIILVIILIAALGAGAYFLLSKDKEKGGGIISNEIINPLTGEAVEELLTRPIQVSIDNAAPARPQSGLSAADIIFEYPVEGSITRIQAIFYTKLPETVGPVRSARPYFVDTAREYKAVFVNHGWSPEAKEYLESGVVPYISGLTYGGGVFFRTDDRPAPDNSMIHTDKLLEAIEKEGYAEEQDVRTFNFLEKGQKVKGEKATAIYINYLTTKCSYEYDRESKLYKKFSNGEVYIDKETGDQITTSNVLIQFVNSQVLDNKGRLGIDMKAGGDAMLFRKGKVIKGTWSREDMDSPTVFTAANGKEMKMATGNTWIQVLDQNHKIEYDAGEEE